MKWTVGLPTFYCKDWQADGPRQCAPARVRGGRDPPLPGPLAVVHGRRLRRRRDPDRVHDGAGGRDAQSGASAGSATAATTWATTTRTWVARTDGRGTATGPTVWSRCPSRSTRPGRPPPPPPATPPPDTRVLVRAELAHRVAEQLVPLVGPSRPRGRSPRAACASVRDARAVGEADRRGGSSRGVRCRAGGRAGDRHRPSPVSKPVSATAPSSVTCARRGTRRGRRPRSPARR